MVAPARGKIDSQPKREPPARIGNARARASAGGCSGDAVVALAVDRTRQQVSHRWRNGAILAAGDAQMLPLGVFDQNGRIDGRRKMRGQRGRTAAGGGNACQRFRVSEQSIDTVAANSPRMNYVLVVHLVVGILVAACAALLVWRRMGRRITLYVLTLQILLGIWLIVAGLRAPAEHYSLALVAWIGYMAANGIARRPGRERIVLAITVVSSICVLIAAYLGARAGNLA